MVTQQRQLTIQHLKLVNVAWGEAYVAQRIPGQGAPNVDFSKLMFLCQVNHPEASPLLLCDTCPRSFHMACLGLSWDDLPEGDADWYCPRCVDRHAAASRNLGYPQDM